MGAARAGSIRQARVEGTAAGNEWLGLVDGEAVAAGPEPARVASRLVPRLRAPEHEILTLIVGLGPSDGDVDRVVAALREAAWGLAVEVHRGGQPRDDYLIGLE
jgi:dihydroxyacetone kinase-like predicted kinase